MVVNSLALRASLCTMCGTRIDLKNPGYHTILFGNLDLQGLNMSIFNGIQRPRVIRALNSNVQIFLAGLRKNGSSYLVAYSYYSLYIPTLITTLWLPYFTHLRS